MSETRFHSAADPWPSRQAGARRWLLLAHQLPTSPSNLRVRTWRRLQQLGAVAAKQAVNVLPDSPAAREDFEWLAEEIRSSGGEASVFVAESVGSRTDDELVQAFRQSSDKAYGELRLELEALLAAPDARKRPDALRARFRAIEAIDFFGAEGRDAVEALLRRLEADQTPLRPPPAGGSARAGDYRSRLWVTRPRPGVDRMASAWLIRRFIDPEARFGFATQPEAAPPEAIPFDMFGVEFSHHGAACTFETLCRVFAIDDRAVGRIAAVVHDLDFKDEHFGAPEAATLLLLIEGLEASYSDDEALLAQGMTLFEAFYRAAAPPKASGRPAASGDLP
jgi:hypothetical protein